jgi:hypothetical protein
MARRVDRRPRRRRILLLLLSTGLAWCVLLAVALYWKVRTPIELTIRTSELNFQVEDHQNGFVLLPDGLSVASLTSSAFESVSITEPLDGSEINAHPLANSVASPTVHFSPVTPDQSIRLGPIRVPATTHVLLRIAIRRTPSCSDPKCRLADLTVQLSQAVGPLMELAADLGGGNVTVALNNVHMESSPMRSSGEATENSTTLLLSSATALATSRRRLHFGVTLRSETRNTALTSQTAIIQGLRFEREEPSTGERVSSVSEDESELRFPTLNRPPTKIAWPSAIAFGAMDRFRLLAVRHVAETGQLEVVAAGDVEEVRIGVPSSQQDVRATVFEVLASRGPFVKWLTISWATLGALMMVWEGIAKFWAMFDVRNSRE